MPSTRGHTGTPIPKREVELRATWSSECVTRPMTEEERIKYGVATPPKITNADGVQERRPIQLPPRKYNHVTKELVLAEFAKGKTIHQIEQEQGMKKNTLQAKMRAWGIRSPRSPFKSEDETVKRQPSPAPASRSDSRIEDIICDVQLELRRAMGKFPPFHSAHEGYAVLKEELEEAWAAIKANDPIHARIEMMQVAAMAIRFLHDIQIPKEAFR
ncbi:hypothetical protein [Aneurinibacillus danicus]|uniref:Uncharacterized protein n=1 Tax=Aneurinibacillus danicus TaxID=267746 RepID=A0A511V9B4_9BACL|nr:hypothetical protein [Aneurinibacillus danicus]GEN33832.1 hypothetical protein ADA01nite_12920 [Aneurinibacillus danicus]